MKELNITPYKFNIPRPEGGVQSADYNFVYSIIGVMFDPEQKRPPHEVQILSRVAHRIMDAEAASQSSVLLEQNEYDLMRRMVDGFQHFQLQDVPLVDRVHDCPTVEVAKKEP